MNWFNWYLNEEEVNGYLWRTGILLLMMFLILGVPGIGKLLWWIVIFDVTYWFLIKKPSLKAMK